MQSQLTRPSGHDQEPEAPVKVHHPEDEGHNEKKPTKVLKKVKKKAKKVKDTLTKRGHNHDHDLDEEDKEDEEEEMIGDSEVHGAPIYESADVRSGITGQPEYLSHPGKSHVPMLEEVVPPGTKVFPAVSSCPTRPAGPVGGSAVFSAHGLPAHPMRESDVFDREESGEALKTPQNTPVSSRREDLTMTFIPGQEESHGQGKVNLDRPRGLVEDPAAPKGGLGVSSYVSNYQTKVTDPTGKGCLGGEELEISPIIQSLGKMKVTDESDINTGPGLEKELPKTADQSVSHLSTGSHDQFSPELSPAKPLENSPSEPEASDTKDWAKDVEKQPKQSSYTEKIASATSVIADKAAAAKDVVVSKLGYSGEGIHERREGEETTKPRSAVEYGRKVASTVTEKLTPVYEKVKETGTGVMTKMPLSGRETHQGQDKGVSVKDYLTEKLKPGEEDKALAEVIAETLHLKGKEGEEKKTRGRVTESEEVAERLGGFGDRRSEEEEKHGESVVGDGKKGGVVEKFKGAVSSWLGSTMEEVKQESSQSLQESSQSLGSTIGTAGFSDLAGGDVGQTGGGAEQRRLQESGN